MARYKVTLAYDGTDFVGSQRQATSRTVQAEFEQAVRKLGWSRGSLLMAGRTDTGVHALGQVAAFDLEWRHSLDDLLHALNAALPIDMAVQTVRVAAEGFHPRFDARSRCYRYRLFCESVRQPLRERYAWRVWPAVDGERLNEVADLWLGRHDFSAFGSSPRPESSPIRTVQRSTWEQHQDEWWYEIEAEAFLYHMVRRLVYVQVAVAQGRLPLQKVQQVLVPTAWALERPPRASKREAGQKVPSGLAPAQGLTLMEVKY